jgi:hypothetical protein
VPVLAGKNDSSYFPVEDREDEREAASSVEEFVLNSRVKDAFENF